MTDSSGKGAPHLSRTISDSLAIVADVHVSVPTYYKYALANNRLENQVDSSDEEFQNALEVKFPSSRYYPSLTVLHQVVFDPDHSRNRRKSSIVLDQAPKLTQRQQEMRKNAACFVHSLLESSSQRGTKSRLGNIEEGEKLGVSNGVVSPTDEGRATQSRLLTKKQLSDMAMGVRDLSKKLGSLKVKLKIRTVFLLTKAHDRTLIRKAREVTRWLLSKDRNVPYIIYVENTLQESKTFDAPGLVAEDPSIEARLKYWDTELAKRQPQTFDFVVTLGGDGTVLYASWLFQRVVPPVLSFALGSLGFLTKFDFENYEETITRAFRDGVTISLRLRFEGTIMRSQRKPDDHEHGDLVEELIGEEGDDHRTHKPEKTFEILNDIVVDRGPNPSEICFLLKPINSANLVISNVYD